MHGRFGGVAPTDGALTVDVPPMTWDGAACDGIGDLCDSATPVCAGSLVCYSNSSGGACTTAGRAACNPFAPLCPPEAPMCLEDGVASSSGVCASEFEVFCICSGTGSGAFTCPL